jgi:hypothetical protein
MNHNPKNQFKIGHKINLGRRGFWNGKKFSEKHLDSLSKAHLNVKLPERSGKNIGIGKVELLHITNY